MEHRVVITGIGAITPVGNHADETWKNLVEGNCGINLIEGLDEYNLPVKVAGQIKNFNQSEYELNAGLARRSDRFCIYAMAAASDAMKDSGLVSGENIEPERLGVYIGSGIGGMDTFVNQTKVLLEEGVGRISPFFVPMMISNIASGNVAISHNAQGVCLPVEQLVLQVHTLQVRLTALLSTAMLTPSSQVVLRLLYTPSQLVASQTARLSHVRRIPSRHRFPSQLTVTASLSLRVQV